MGFGVRLVHGKELLAGKEAMPSVAQVLARMDMATRATSRSVEETGEETLTATLCTIRPPTSATVDSIDRHSASQNRVSGSYSMRPELRCWRSRRLDASPRHIARATFESAPPPRSSAPASPTSKSAPKLPSNTHSTVESAAKTVMGKMLEWHSDEQLLTRVNSLAITP